MSDIYGLSKNSRFTVEGNYMTGNDFNITNANQPTKLVRLGLDGMIPSNLYVAGGGGAGTVVSVNHQLADGSGNVTVTTDAVIEGTNKYMHLPINITDVSGLNTSLGSKVAVTDTNYCKTVNNLTCTNNNISLTTDNITE